MSTASTCGLFLRTLFCFCLLMALRAQAGWQGDPPLQNKYREHEFLAACLEGNGPAVAFYLEMESCLLYTSPSPRDRQKSRMPSSA